MSKATMMWDSQSHQHESNPAIPPLLPSAVDQEICEFLQELNECSNLGLTASELVSLAKGNFGSENPAVHCQDYPDCDVTSPTERSEYRCHVIPIQPKRKHDILFVFNKKYKMVTNLNQFFGSHNVRLTLLKTKPEFHIIGPKSPEIIPKVTSLVQQIRTVKDIQNWLIELGAPPCAGDADIGDDELVVTSTSFTTNFNSQIIANESSPVAKVAMVAAAASEESTNPPKRALLDAKSQREAINCVGSFTGAEKQTLEGCIVCGKNRKAGSVFCSEDFTRLKVGLVAKAKQLPRSVSSSALGSGSSTLFNDTKLPHKPEL